MALRIARGLFRLWLILLVLWIGGVGAVTWWTLPMPSADREVAPWDTPPPSAGEFDPDKFLALKLAEERRSAIWFASAVALVPPAFVLALERIPITFEHSPHGAPACRRCTGRAERGEDLRRDHTTRELWPSGLSVDIMLRFRSPCDARKPHTRPFRRIRPAGTNG
jgi:hypothetical protein